MYKTLFLKITIAFGIIIYCLSCDPKLASKNSSKTNQTASQTSTNTTTDTNTDISTDTNIDTDASSSTQLWEQFCSAKQNDTLLTTISPLTRKNNQFALELYKKAASSEPVANLMLSPFSISSALAMTYAGAKGNTATEMASVLHFDLSDLHSLFKTTFEFLKCKDASYELSIANRLWVQNSYQLLDDYTNLTKTNYASTLRQLDFKTKTSAAIAEINTWTEEMTKDRIKDLVSSNNVTSDTRLVLENAIYFKSKWESEFLKEKTSNAAFYTDQVTSVDKAFMTKTDFRSHTYYETTDYKALCLDFLNGDGSACFILPKEKTGLSTLENALTSETLETIWNNMGPLYKVDVSLPKFKFESSSGLKDILTELGMPTAFSESANFSGIFAPNQEPLAIGDVLHKTYIDFNEEGAEAAAATAVVMKTLASLDPEVIPDVEFKADHPFIFIIKHYDIILFMGRVQNPIQ